MDDVRNALRHVYIDSKITSREPWLDIGHMLHDWDVSQGLLAFSEWTTNLIMQRPGMSNEPFGWEDLPAAWERFENSATPATRKIESLFSLASVFAPDYEDPTRASAIARDYYYVDGRSYVRRLANRRWQLLTETQMKRELKAEHNAETKCEKHQSASELEKAMHEIETKRLVDGMAPFAHDRRDIVDYAGNRYLNESRNHPVIALSGSRAWGQGFPFIGSLIDGMFKPEAKDHVLAWLADACLQAPGEIRSSAASASARLPSSSHPSASSKCSWSSDSIADILSIHDVGVTANNCRNALCVIKGRQRGRNHLATRLSLVSPPFPKLPPLRLLRLPRLVPVGVIVRLLLPCQINGLPACLKVNGETGHIDEQGRMGLHQCFQVRQGADRCLVLARPTADTHS